jgi:hypothetical protein
MVSSYDTIPLHSVTDNRALSRIRYDERLLKMTGLPREKLPDLVPAGHRLLDIVGLAVARFAERFAGFIGRRRKR